MISDATYGLCCPPGRSDARRAQHRYDRVSDVLEGFGDHTGADHLELAAVSQAGLDRSLFEGIHQGRHQKQRQVDDITMIVTISEVVNDLCKAFFTRYCRPHGRRTRVCLQGAYSNSRYGRSNITIRGRPQRYIRQSLMPGFTCRSDAFLRKWEKAQGLGIRGGWLDSRALRAKQGEHPGQAAETAMGKKEQPFDLFTIIKRLLLVEPMVASWEFYVRLTHLPLKRRK